MRETKKLMVERTITTSVTCDVCGTKTVDDRWPREAAVAVAVASFPYTEQDTDQDTTVSLRIQTPYPEGGNGLQWDLDVCPRCFEKHILPLVRDPEARKGREFDW